MDEEFLEELSNNIDMTFEIDAENASAAIYEDIMATSEFFCEVPKEADLTSNTVHKNKFLLGGALLGVAVATTAIIMVAKRRKGGSR